MLFRSSRVRKAPSGLFLDIENCSSWKFSSILVIFLCEYIFIQERMWYQGACLQVLLSLSDIPFHCANIHLISLLLYGRINDMFNYSLKMISASLFNTFWVDGVNNYVYKSYFRELFWLESWRTLQPKAHMWKSTLSKPRNIL